MPAQDSTGPLTCKLCRKNPRFSDNRGHTSLYCSNACAKRAGAPLPNPDALVKRSKALSLAQLLAKEADIKGSGSDLVEPSLASRGIWKIDSKDGQKDVILTRVFRNETIRVRFAMAELDPVEPDEESDDEDRDQFGGSVPTDRYDDNASDAGVYNSIECSISVSKPHEGALLFEGFASPKGLEVFRISYIRDQRLVNEDTADSERKLQSFGVGPEYDDLPKRIQEEFTKYLDQRGINKEFAQFICDFITYKTQKEALGWFQHVEKFVAEQ